MLGYNGAGEAYLPAAADEGQTIGSTQVARSLMADFLSYYKNSVPDEEKRIKEFVLTDAWESSENGGIFNAWAGFRVKGYLKEDDWFIGNAAVSNDGWMDGIQALFPGDEGKRNIQDAELDCLSVNA